MIIKRIRLTESTNVSQWSVPKLNRLNNTGIVLFLCVKIAFELYFPQYSCRFMLMNYIFPHILVDLCWWTAVGVMNLRNDLHFLTFYNNWRCSMRNVPDCWLTTLCQLDPDLLMVGKNLRVVKDVITLKTVASVDSLGALSTQLHSILILGVVRI